MTLPEVWRSWVWSRAPALSWVWMGNYSNANHYEHVFFLVLYVCFYAAVWVCPEDCRFVCPAFDPEKNLILTLSVQSWKWLAFIPFSQLLMLIISLHRLCRVSLWHLFMHFFCHLLIYIRGGGGKKESSSLACVLSALYFAPVMRPVSGIWLIMIGAAVSA